MELLIQILIGFIAIAAVMRLSFFESKFLWIWACFCAAFVFAVYPWAIDQTKFGISTYIEDRFLREWFAILVSFEVVFFVAYSFLPRHRPKKWWNGVLYGFFKFYPGFLVLPILFYLETNLMFSFSGVDFQIISILFAVSILLTILLATWGVRMLLPEEEGRKEVFFFLSLLVFALGVITTVNEPIRIAPESKPLNWKHVLLAISFFVPCFLLGRYTYLYNYLRNKFFSNSK